MAEQLTPEERVKGLYKRIVSPTTGEFVTREPTSREIAVAIREAEETGAARTRTDVQGLVEAARHILSLLDHPERSVTALDADRLREAVSKFEAQAEEQKQ